MKNKFALALLVGVSAVSGAHGFGLSAFKNTEVKKEEKVAQKSRWRRYCDDIVNPRWERLTESAKVPAPTRFARLKQSVTSGYNNIVAGCKSGYTAAQTKVSSAATSAKETVKKRPYTTATIVAAAAIGAGAYGWYTQEDADNA